MKRRTNHEGQPRLQTSQLIDAVNTAVQKLTHPKVRESKQGEDTVAQRADNPNWSTLTQGAEPSEPLQASRSRRSTEKRREGLPPNLRHQGSRRTGTRWQKRQKIPKGTCCRVSCSNCRPRRKSTAQGREPSDAPDTFPTTRLHRKSRPANWSQKGCRTR